MKNALLVAVSCIGSLGLLAGCAGPVSFPDAGASGVSIESKNGMLQGQIHGGQQPIAGAQIYLFAAGTTGYGSASTSLLKSTGAYANFPVTADSSGNFYVTTDAGGNFQIADTCSSGQQVYVASIGGNPGSGTNTAANLIAILGQCPSAGNFDSLYSGVYISEISTVAAAYATAAYAVDATHIGGPSSTTLQTTAIANAFANAASLYDVTRANQARTSTANGNGTVPQTKIHTIANILASCVNSTGSGSSSCATLFKDAESAGTSGTAPTDTTVAALNIAHNPWAHVKKLFNLITSTAPFSPTLSGAPSDFTVAITYSNAALAQNPSMAVDAGGDLWMGSPGTGALVELSPVGKVLSGSSGYSTGTSVPDIRAVAVLPNGYVAALGATTDGGDNVASGAEVSSSGALEFSAAEGGGPDTYPPSSATNLVIDRSGNFYYAATKYINGTASTTCCTMKVSISNGAFTELDNGKATPGTNFLALNGTNLWVTSNTSTAELYTTAATVESGGGLNAAQGVALDSAGNAWFTNSGNNSISEFNSSGTAVSGTSGYTGGGLATPVAVAVDGSSVVWAVNSSGSYGLSQFTSAGTAVGNGFSTTGLNNPASLVLDSSGNAWVSDSSSTTILEFLGLSSPVVTPIVTAVTNGTLGTEP